MLKEIDIISFFFFDEKLSNFHMEVLAMVTLKSCNLILGKYMRKYLKITR